MMRKNVVKDVTRFVVKLGAGVFTDSRKLIDPAQLEQLVAQVSETNKKTISSVEGLIKIYA
jgi:glutamate 5-kinase